jgi:hypothetical protein
MCMYVYVCICMYLYIYILIQIARLRLLLSGPLLNEGVVLVEDEINKLVSRIGDHRITPIMLTVNRNFSRWPRRCDRTLTASHAS